MATVWGRHFFGLGPLLALGGVAALALFLKWAFPGRNTSLIEKTPQPGHPDDYGLLTAVGAPVSAVEATMWQQALTDAGIRSTLTLTTQGTRVMVRRDEANRAADLLKGIRGGSNKSS